MKKTGPGLIILLILTIISGCGQEKNRTRVDVGNSNVGEVEIKRYGKTIFSIDTSILQQELKKIKPDYPLFLDGDLDDPETIKRMRDFITDKKLIGINADVNEQFADLAWLQKDLSGLINHYAYYFPEQKVPEVYTYVSGFDFEFRTQYYNDNLLIALDMYLGKDYPAYQKLGLPLYVIRQFQPEYILKDCAYEMGRSGLIYRKLGNHLIDFMINEGKLLWFVKAMIPEIDDGILLDYTVEQLEWVKNNEQMIWAFIIENEVLYSSEPDYVQKFIIDAPFTSYFGNESPPRLGAFIGYKIVDSYMQKNEQFELKNLMEEYDPRMILKLSKYKPD